MTINFRYDPAGSDFIGFPAGMDLTPCSVTGKIGCQDRKCEIHYMDAPFNPWHPPLIWPL